MSMDNYPPSKDSISMEKDDSENHLAPSFMKINVLNKNSQGIIYNTNEKVYTLNMEIIDNRIKIIIESKLNKNLNDISFYQRTFSLEELLNINKIFRLYENIEDALVFFIDILSDSSNKPIIKENEISLSIFQKINLIKKKTENIIIEIPKFKSKFPDNNNNTLSKKITQKEKNDLINNKESLENIETEIIEENFIFEKQENILELINRENIDLKRRIEVLEHNNNQLIKIFRDSEKIFQSRLQKLENQLKLLNDLLTSIREDNINSNKKKKLLCKKKRSDSDSLFYIENKDNSFKDFLNETGGAIFDISSISEKEYNFQPSNISKIEILNNDLNTSNYCNNDNSNFFTRAFAEHKQKLEKKLKGNMNEDKTKSKTSNNGENNDKSRSNEEVTQANEKEEINENYLYGDEESIDKIIDDISFFGSNLNFITDDGRGKKDNDNNKKNYNSSFKNDFDNKINNNRKMMELDENKEDKRNNLYENEKKYYNFGKRNSCDISDDLNKIEKLTKNVQISSL